MISVWYTEEGESPKFRGEFGSERSARRRAAEALGLTDLRGLAREGTALGFRFVADGESVELRFENGSVPDEVAGRPRGWSPSSWRQR